MMSDQPSMDSQAGIPLTLFKPCHRLGVIQQAYTSCGASSRRHETSDRLVIIAHSVHQRHEKIGAPQGAFLDRVGQGWEASPEWPGAWHGARYEAVTASGDARRAWR
jgi:hypothetical protein